tara:strand:+ start:287 stop:499 length:213 start_codon:yes stop_codon:yes gene_type:complete
MEVIVGNSAIREHLNESEMSFLKTVFGLSFSERSIEKAERLEIYRHLDDERVEFHLYDAAGGMLEHKHVS